MARVLVTGASGFVGHQLVDALLNHGDDVGCLVRARSKTAELEKKGCRLVRGDVTDPPSLRAAVADVDVIYHVAGLTKANTYRSYCCVNEAGTAGIVDACTKQTSPPVFILLSSLSAAGAMPDETPRTEDLPPSPASSYGRSKRAGELAAEARAAAVPITVIRPPVVIGPGDVASLAVFRSISKFGVHPMLGLGRRVSLIHTADLSAAMIAAAEHGERLPPPSGNGSSAVVAGQGYYFVAADERPTYAELGHLVANAVGRTKIRLVRIPRALVYSLATGNEAWGRLLRRPRYLNLDRVREMKAGHWICSAAKAHAQLGFTPGASLQDRITQTDAWYKEHGWL
jgi:nucleoside-diphosphate-sugar epimerase